MDFNAPQVSWQDQPWDAKCPTFQGDENKIITIVMISLGNTVFTLLNNMFVPFDRPYTISH